MKMFSKALCASLILFLMACSTETPDVTPEADTTVEAGSEKPAGFAVFNPRVDILFVIDNSASMRQAQEELARNAEIFSKAMSKATILDFHIGITSTDMKRCTDGKSCGYLWGATPYVEKSTPNLAAELASRMILGLNGDATETMFAPTIAALSSPLETGANAGFYRQEAYFAVIFITDANDQSSVTPQQLLEFLQKKKGDPSKVLGYGVIRKVAEQQTCPSQLESVDMKLETFLGSVANGDKRQTNILSLCATDYGQKLAEFANDIVKRSSNRIPLKRLPVVETIRVFYGRQELPMGHRTGWTYNPSTNSIILGDDIPWDTSQGYNAELRVDFEVIPQDTRRF